MPAGSIGTAAGAACVTSDSFQDDGQALADADADRGQPVAAAAGVQRVREVPDDAGAGAPERMSDRDRAAVLTLTIDGSRSGHSARQASDCAANASLSSTSARSSQPMPGALQRDARRLDRADAEVLRFDRSHAARHDARERRAVRELRRRRSSPISSAAAPSLSGEALPAVTVPSGRNAGLSCGQRLTVRVGTDRFVAGQSTPGTRDDLVGEHTGVPGGGGVLVAGHGERVLRVARDAVLLGQQLGRLAERDRPVTRHLLVDHPPAQRGRVQRLGAGRESLAPA